MKRRLFILGLAGTTALGVLAGPAVAATYAEDVVAQLTSLGFSDISVETTWLGRIRILASRSGGMREIVLNPRTGEILRDVWTPQSTNGVRRVVLDDVEDDGNSGTGGGDDHSGSGGSGSGSGGSGSGSDDDSPDDSGEDDNSGKDDSGEKEDNSGNGG